MEYRKEIDGLRAVAVVPVVLYHGGFGVLPGGFLGVDVFFVISGYLITSIILGDLAAGRFSLGRFYERRVRRIFPALFLVMACCIPAAWYALAPNDLEDFSKSVVAVTLFSSNILFWRQSGYFDTAAELKPLLHTWSLAVEEQYYVVFPLLLAALRRFGRTALLAMLTALALPSLALAIWLSPLHPDMSFYLLPTRAWELLLGAIAASYVHHRGRLPDGRSPLAHVASVVGLAGIAASMLALDANMPTPGVSTLAPTVGAGLVILFASAGNPVARLLSTPLAVGIGLISYSVYLWHQPLFVFARHLSMEEPGMLLYLGLTIATFLLAYLSWAYVERPFRERGRLTRGRLFGLAVAGSAAFAAFGLYGVKTRGFADRPGFAVTAIPGYSLNNDHYKNRTFELMRAAAGVEHHLNIGSPGDQTLWFTNSPSTTKVLIIGNSHSGDLFNVFGSCRELFPTMEFARYGVQLSDFGHPEGDALFETPNYKAADVILVSTRWSGFRFEQRSRGRSDFRGLESLIPRVAQDGKLLVLSTESPHFPHYGSLTLADSLVIKWSRRHATAPTTADECVDFINHQYYESLDDSRRTHETNVMLRQLADRYGLIVLDKTGFLSDHAARRCLAVFENGDKAFWDEAHYTLEGAKAFGRRAAEIGWLGPVEQALAAKTGQRRSSTGSAE